MWRRALVDDPVAVEEGSTADHAGRIGSLSSLDRKYSVRT
jgi:hypothetical protein